MSGANRVCLFRALLGKISLPYDKDIIRIQCLISYSKRFCFGNMMPCSFDYLMYPYYPAYTMGCYQIVISGDNGSNRFTFVLVVFSYILLQERENCNCTSPSYILRYLTNSFFECPNPATIFINMCRICLRIFFFLCIINFFPQFSTYVKRTSIN